MLIASDCIIYNETKGYTVGCTGQGKPLADVQAHAVTSWSTLKEMIMINNQVLINCCNIWQYLKVAQ